MLIVALLAACAGNPEPAVAPPAPAAKVDTPIAPPRPPPSPPAAVDVYACPGAAPAVVETPAEAPTRRLLRDGGVRLVLDAEGENTWAGAGVTLRVDGAEAHFTRSGVSSVCPRDPVASQRERHLSRGVEIAGQGNEPGWTVTIRSGVGSFALQYGEQVFDAPMSASPLPDGEAFSGRHGEQDVRVELRQKPCQDSMSGFAFPATVRVAVGSQPPLTGCGFDLRTR